MRYNIENYEHKKKTNNKYNQNMITKKSINGNASKMMTPTIHFNIFFANL